MKKVISILLCMVLSVVFCGCGETGGSGFTSNKKFNVKEIFINEGKVNYLEKELINMRDDTVVASEGTFIKCGDVQLVQLNKNLNEENDSSQVYFAIYKNYTFLFMGDASIKTEEYILNNSEIIKSAVENNKLYLAKCHLCHQTGKVYLLDSNLDYVDIKDI